MQSNVFSGHFLTRAEVAEVVGCAVSDVGRRLDLLAMAARWSGDRLYPAMQFDSDGNPTPHMEELLARLGGAMSDTDLACACTQPAAMLSGRTPLAWLRSGGSVDRAVQYLLAG
ncbi:MAG: hypothetical protein OEX04_18235 [Acidimicrobiia bacterium]|nr:hypothetical protein [Acidimicrobiia bacterium]MDH4309413.1 hypothetical protein [Acidimicrobiia bacterium]